MGVESVTYSGKEIKSLIRLRSKINGMTKSRMERLKWNGRRGSRIRRANRMVVDRIQSRMRDILHKTSRAMVNYAVSKRIGKISFGDCSRIHDETSLKRETQAVQQRPEQKLRKYVEYKFASVGGTSELVPEHYTSQTCPKCGRRYYEKTRSYSCRQCGFEFDRDGVGAINIYHRIVNVSSGGWLGVVGSLTEPRGWKYHPRLSCMAGLDRDSGRTPRL